MIRGLISKQLKNLPYEPNDVNYLNGENDIPEQDDSLMNRHRSQMVRGDTSYLKKLIERKYKVQIINNDVKSIRDIYNFFIGGRIENVSDIIYSYIYDNIDDIYDRYNSGASRSEVDKMVDIAGDTREEAVIKNSLNSIIQEAINMDLSHYISRDTLHFLTSSMDILDNNSVYDILTSTVISSDLHFVFNIGEKIKNKIKKEGV